MKNTRKRDNKAAHNGTALCLGEAVDSLQSPAIRKLTDEWSGVEPSKKDMGVVKLTLDRGVKTTIIGTIYGLDFEIEEDGYKANVFFDYYNRRLKIRDYECIDYSSMLRRLAWLAKANSFTKTFVKARPCDFQKFLSHGYMTEGILRYYFKGEDAYVLSRFSSPERIRSKHLIDESMLIEDIIYNTKPLPPRKAAKNIKIIHATEQHIPELVFIYRQVFETYPSPLTNPDYIKAVLNADVRFVLAFEDGQPIGAASADITRKYSNGELTDCATIPAARGKGLMQILLHELEKLLVREGIQTSYSLARAKSIGMNKCFFRMDYEYSGRLINNCDIFGEFEDLNIWVKKLPVKGRRAKGVKVPPTRRALASSRKKN